MKRAKEKTSAKASNKASAGKKRAQRAVDLAAIRQQITNLVGNGAVGMVETTIEEVGKGHYLGMKYLFEMVGSILRRRCGWSAGIQIRWRRRCCAVWVFRKRHCRKRKLPKMSKCRDAVSDDGLE